MAFMKKVLTHLRSGRGETSAIAQASQWCNSSRSSALYGTEQKPPIVRKSNAVGLAACHLPHVSPISQELHAKTIANGLRDLYSEYYEANDIPHSDTLEIENGETMECMRVAGRNNNSTELVADQQAILNAITHTLSLEDSARSMKSTSEC